MSEVGRISVVALLMLTSVPASAQSAFVEGHVFNVATRRPLPGAEVRIFETVTLGPVPIQLGEAITDANGFYEIEVDQFLGFPARIEVTCVTPIDTYAGTGSALLREDTLRRDIYLTAPLLIRGCVQAP
jgi:hypothetical protein